jgi:hypothetical protein
MPPAFLVDAAELHEIKCFLLQHNNIPLLEGPHARARLSDEAHIDLAAQQGTVVILLHTTRASNCDSHAYPPSCRNILAHCIEVEVHPWLLVSVAYLRWLYMVASAASC